MGSEAFFRVHQDAYLEMHSENPPELAANQKFVACVVEIDIMEVSQAKHISIISWNSSGSQGRNPTVNQKLVEIDQLHSWACQVRF